MKLLLAILLMIGFTAIHAQDESSSAEDKAYIIVEQSARFPGCEDLEEEIIAKEACAQRKMLEFIYSRLEYPTDARKQGLEGRVVLQFIISKTGVVEDLVIKKDPGAGLGQAAVAVIEQMNTEKIRWIPAMNDGKPVKIQYVLPIQFKLGKK